MNGIVLQMYIFYNVGRYHLYQEKQYKTQNFNVRLYYYLYTKHQSGMYNSLTTTGSVTPLLDESASSFFSPVLTSALLRWFKLSLIWSELTVYNFVIIKYLVSSYPGITNLNLTISSIILDLNALKHTLIDIFYCFDSSN